MLLQIIFIIVLLIALGFTWRRAKQKAIRRIEAIGWSFVWIVAGVVILRPSTTTAVAHLFGIGRGVDVVLYASIIILFLLVFHLQISHDRLQRTLTELVRREALKKLDDISKNNVETGDVGHRHYNL